MDDQEAIAMIGRKKIREMTCGKKESVYRERIAITIYAIIVTILAGTIIIFSLMWESVIK